MTCSSSFYSHDLGSSLMRRNYEDNFEKEIRKAEQVELDLTLPLDELLPDRSGPFVLFILSGTTNDEYKSFETIQMVRVDSVSISI